MAGIFPDFHVTLDDGTEYEALVKFKDARAFEQFCAREDIDVTSSPFTMGVFYAWREARKQGLCAPDESLDDFGDRIDHLRKHYAGDTPVPTGPAPGAG